MKAVDFPEANKTFGPPTGMRENQVASIHAYSGEIQGESLDGATLVVTAWKPSAKDIETIKQGGLVYFTCLGDAPPPHKLSTYFPVNRQATG